MPAADWTSISNGSGAFVIVADGTAPSPPDVMQITSGGQFFQNITAGPFKNSRVVAWCFQPSFNASDFYLALRSLDNTTFITAPASFFLARIRIETSSTFSVIISAIVNGVETVIANIHNIPVNNGNPQNSWQQYQFSSFNSGTDILLRVSQWNGAVFIPVVDAAAPIASFPTLDAAGECRFGSLITSGAVKIDDVKYYSLA